MAADELQKQAEREKLLAEQSKRQAEEAKIATARTKISAVVAEIGNQMISIPAHRCHIGDGSEKHTPWNPERWIEFPKLRFQKYDITSDTYELFATVTGQGRSSCKGELGRCEGIYQLVERARQYEVSVTDRAGMGMRGP